MTDASKTIAAVATAAGRGAIGIIRISGRDTLKGLRAIFPDGKSFDHARMVRRKLAAGDFRDDCMAVFFRGPKSYTGEDSAELYLHGSPLLLGGVVDFLVENCGFVRAEGGDFTARAMLNGKLDLTAAEGVADIVDAESKAQLRGAYSLLSGELKTRIEALQREILRVRACTEAAIDYPEEDVEEQTRGELAEEIAKLTAEAERLVGSYRGGRLREYGVKVALIGRPNAGKSSLLNALVGFDRAIVTPEAGTTRDTVSERYIYRGVLFLVDDTAGLREAESLPEKLGVERAVEAAKTADVVVLVSEPGGPATDIGRALPDHGKSDGRAVIRVINKSDLGLPAPEEGALTVSALTGEGIEELKNAIYERSGVLPLSSEEAAIVNDRQFSAVSEALSALRRAGESVSGREIELISSDLYDAYAALGAVTGLNGSDALVEEIFSRFCVGK